MASRKQHLHAVPGRASTRVVPAYAATMSEGVRRLTTAAEMAELRPKIETAAFRTVWLDALPVVIGRLGPLKQDRRTRQSERLAIETA